MKRQAFLVDGVLALVLFEDVHVLVGGAPSHGVAVLHPRPSRWNRLGAATAEIRTTSDFAATTRRLYRRTLTP